MKAGVGICVSTARSLGSSIPGEALEEEISGISRCVLHVKGELSRNNYNDPQCERAGRLPALPLRIVLIFSEYLVTLALGIRSQLGPTLMKLQQQLKNLSQKEATSCW